MPLNLQLLLRPMSGGLKRHLKFVSTEVSQCLSSELFSDLELVTLGGPIPCHLSVLAPLSPVLRMLLSAVPPCPGSVYTVILPEKREIVQNMIQIIYSGRVKLPSQAHVKAVLSGLGILGINLPGLEYYMPYSRTFILVSRDEEQLSAGRVESMESSSVCPPALNHALSQHWVEDEFYTDIDEEANINTSVFSPPEGRDASFIQQSTSNIIMSKNTQSDTAPSTLLTHELMSTTMIEIMEQSSSNSPTKQRAPRFQQEAISMKEIQLPGAMPEEDVIRSCIPYPDIEPPNLGTLVRHLAVDVDTTTPHELIVAKGLDASVAGSDQHQANDHSKLGFQSTSGGIRVVTPSTYEIIQDIQSSRGKKRRWTKSCRSNPNMITEKKVSSLYKCPELNCNKQFASSKGVKIHLALSHCEVGDQVCFCRSLELENIILTGYGETKCLMCDERLRTEVNRELDMEIAWRDSSGVNNVETPRYRVIEYGPSYIIEGTENVSDEAFLKRHDKKEKEEKRRKRWDAQAVREQERVAKLRSRLNKKETLRPTSEGSLSVDEITHIFVSDQLPSTQM